jgi:hypothetical protein
MDGGKVFFVTKFCQIGTRKKNGAATHTKDVLWKKSPKFAIFGGIFKKICQI